MELGMKFPIFVLFIFILYGQKTFVYAHKCKFPAIFNFGDSNSDTGGAYGAFHSNGWPNGVTLGKISKRACDGLLIIDYMAKSLGFPYLNGTMDTVGTSFKYGANFAVGGQRVDPAPDPDPTIPNHWGYHLNKQVSQFFDFKSRAIASKGPESVYPTPEVFSEALYTIDIGQNDVTGVFGWGKASTIVEYFTASVKRLLDAGAKYMWIHNTGPLGCTPSKATACPSNPNWDCSNDKIGCKNFLNVKSQEYNTELKKSVDKLRKEYPEAVITLVDMYSAKYNLISKGYGFDKESKFKFCCGYGTSYCATISHVNGTDVFGDTCKDPSKYISWDGVHYTQAANNIIAKQIIHGDFSEPRVALSHACRH